MTTPVWHSLDARSATQALQVDPAHGLAPQEAARRLTQYGPNELTQEEKAARATYAVQNSGTIEALEQELAEILSKLNSP